MLNVPLNFGTYHDVKKFSRGIPAKAKIMRKRLYISSP
jgi:hypothetical protein